MYFLTEEERKKVLRGLLPKAREADVAGELRGWSWNASPMAPAYNVKVALYEIAGKYCPTGRDLFLRRVMGVPTVPNADMVRGAIHHENLAAILSKAKKLLYLHGVEGSRSALQSLRQRDREAVSNRATILTEDCLARIERETDIVWEYEHTRIAFRVTELLAKQPYIGSDALVSLAVPIVVEQKLDGSFLGMSSHLSSDAYMFAEPVLMDMKCGERKEFHKLTVTGYALVMEALHEFPVNLGATVYPRFKGDRLIVDKEFFIIDDELRQWFLEERDRKMRMLYEEIDPGVSRTCSTECPYHAECHGV